MELLKSEKDINKIFIENGEKHGSIKEIIAKAKESRIVLVEVDKKFLLTRGDVIIAMTGAELGKTGYLFGKENSYFLNQRVGVVRGNDIFSSLYLNCVFLLEKMQNTLNSKGYGSAQPNISKSDIENIEIPIPDEIELKKFYEIANPIYNKMILNSEQNQYLTKLRDALLPKLMNGEIDLDNIEI